MISIVVSLIIGWIAGKAFDQALKGEIYWRKGTRERYKSEDYIDQVFDQIIKNEGGNLDGIAEENVRISLMRRAEDQASLVNMAIIDVIMGYDRTVSADKQNIRNFNAFLETQRLFYSILIESGEFTEKEIEAEWNRFIEMAAAEGGELTAEAVSAFLVADKGEEKIKDTLLKSMGYESEEELYNAIYFGHLNNEDMFLAFGETAESYYSFSESEGLFPKRGIFSNKRRNILLKWGYIDKNYKREGSKIANNLPIETLIVSQGKAEEMLNNVTNNQEGYVFREPKEVTDPETLEAIEEYKEKAKAESLFTTEDIGKIGSFLYNLIQDNEEMIEDLQTVLFGSEGYGSEQALSENITSRVNVDELMPGIMEGMDYNKIYDEVAERLLADLREENEIGADGGRRG